MPSKNDEPVLFLWSFSPWASKVVAYLALRGIPHARCEQPITQPRPDLAALGVKYRRIPVLSIGRDIYCDSLLILEKLERLYSPSSGYKSIGATNPTEKALEKLFEKWTDVVVFKPAAAAIPTDMDLMKDPGFQADREKLWGRPWSKEVQDGLRPAGLAALRANFDFLEDCLSDGRQWLTGNEGPKLTDIHACWIFDWLFQLPDAYKGGLITSDRYPRTFAWRERYNKAIEAAKEVAPKPSELEGPVAVEQILSSPFHDAEELSVDEDPIPLSQGQQVQMWPVDTGYDCKDEGELVGLNAHEAVIEAPSQQKPDTKVRIHYPRWNFEIKAS